MQVRGFPGNYSDRIAIVRSNGGGGITDKEFFRMRECLVVAHCFIVLPQYVVYVEVCVADNVVHRTLCDGRCSSSNSPGVTFPATDECNYSYVLHIQSGHARTKSKDCQIRSYHTWKSTRLDNNAHACKPAGTYPMRKKRSGSSLLLLLLRLLHILQRFRLLPDLAAGCGRSGGGLDIRKRRRRLTVLQPRLGRRRRRRQRGLNFPEIEEFVA